MNISTTLTSLTQRITPGLIAVTLFASAMNAAHAAYLVDTGIPTKSSYYYTVYNHGSDRLAYVAASFNIASASTITSLGSYFDFINPGTVTYELRQGGPTGVLLTSSSVYIEAKSGTPGYVTKSDLSINVAAGDYTLNVLANDSFYGFMSFTSIASSGPNRLTATYENSDGATWSQTDGVLRLGIQVGGMAPAPVPAPLPILGAFAAFGWSRKLRKRIKEANLSSSNSLSLTQAV